MKKFAVIGSPISHSLSPQIHTIFAEQNNVQISYEAIEVEEKDFATKRDIHLLLIFFGIVHNQIIAAL